MRSVPYLHHNTAAQAPGLTQLHRQEPRQTGRRKPWVTLQDGVTDEEKTLREHSPQSHAITKQGWSSRAGEESLMTGDVSRLLWTICRDLILRQTNWMHVWRLQAEIKRGKGLTEGSHHHLLAHSPKSCLPELGSQHHFPAVQRCMQQPLGTLPKPLSPVRNIRGMPLPLIPPVA